MPNINTVDEFNAALEAGPYAWPGGYPLFFLMSDGETMSYKAAEENADQVREAIADGSGCGWRVVAVEVNWEDADMVCCHSGEPIDCAYPPDDEEEQT